MNAIGTRRTTGISRRTLAKTLGGGAAAVFLPARSGAADTPTPASGQIADSHADALVDAALSATPASLTAEQRLDVRRGVRDLQKALADAREAKLDYGVEPATVFLPEERR